MIERSVLLNKKIIVKKSELTNVKKNIDVGLFSQLSTVQ